MSTHSPDDILAYGRNVVLLTVGNATNFSTFAHKEKEYLVGFPAGGDSSRTVINTEWKELTLTGVLVDIVVLENYHCW